MMTDRTEASDSGNFRRDIVGPAIARVYLDFDGVLHPDAAFRTRNGIELLYHPRCGTMTL